jgi:Fic family protein
MKPPRYKLESEKSDNKYPKYFLVRYISFKGKHSRVRQYLGTTEPTPDNLAKAIRNYAYDLELKAAEKVAEIACSYYTADYLSQSEIKEIEKLRFLHNSYVSSLDKIEFEVYTQQNESLYIHGTTAIEGNTLTLRETHYLLNEEIVPKEKSLREINEVQNFKHVKAYVKEYKGKVDLKFIRELHPLIMNNIDIGFESPGTFRRHNLVYIGGCDLGVTLANMIEVDLKDLITSYYDSIKNKKHPFEQAILFHYKFELIHPFSDGNGRTGREILNYILKKEGYPQMIIPKESREAYISALTLGNNNKNVEMMKIFTDLLLTGCSKELTDLRNVVVPAKGQTQLDTN